MGATAIWLAFVLCLGVIFFAGSKLSVLGDRLGDESGLGGTWIGVALLSSITSLPELITGFSSVAIAKTPEIAVGDILGSCAFNVALLVLIHAATWRRTPLFAQTGGSHVLPASFGIILLGVVAGEIITRSLGMNLSIFGLGPFVPLSLILYLVGIRLVFWSAANEIAAAAEATLGDEAHAAPVGIQRQTVIGIAIAAVFVIAGGAALPFVGAELALMMGWHQSFVGTLLIAIATSAPEIAVTLAAARMGALDLAIGNVFGSNMFNILILALDDIFYRDGPLLADVSPAHGLTAIITMVMTGIAIAAMSYRRPSGPSAVILSMSAGLALLYIGNAVIMFLLGQ